MTHLKGPLSGIRVIDLTRVLAGPYCTMMLAEQGAEIVKIETPRGGDDSRHIGPFIDGRSGYFMSINRGKKSVALDLKAPEDRRHFETLLATADVLVENYRGGTMEKLGYGWDVLHARYPRLIYCAISGFGHTGPYAKKPAYDMIVQAMGGIMSITGYAGQPPARVGASIGDLAAGMYGASAVQGALFHRERTGEPTGPDEGRALDLLKCYLALRSDELRIAPKHLATAHQLLAILRAKPRTSADLAKPGLLAPHAAELLGEDLIDFLAGRTVLSLDGACVRRCPSAPRAP